MATIVPISIVLPVSEKLFAKMKSMGKSDAVLKEILEVLEEWAEMDGTSKADGTSHITCGNKRIERKICLHHRKMRKRGCGSCKTGKIIQKIAEFEQQLLELEFPNKSSGKTK